MSVRRVINAPKRGIGEATVAAIEGFTTSEDIPFLEAARRADEIWQLGARAKGAVAAFVDVVDTLGALCLSMLLMDWVARTWPTRGERVS